MPSRRVVVPVAAVAVSVVMVVGVLLWRHHHRPSPWLGLEVPGADAARVDALGQRLDCRPQVMSRFVKLDGDFSLDDLRAMASGGRTPLLTLEPWSWASRPGEADPAYSLESIIEGRHDAALREFAAILHEYGGPVMVRFAHEMNADWYPWGMGVNGNTPERYVEAWRHVHALVEGAGVDVRWVWSPVAAWWPDATPLRDLYPGDDEVDVVAASGYGRADLASTMVATFEGWHDEVRAFTDKPAIIAETGADADVRDDYLAGLGDFFAQFPDVEGFVWFDTSPESTGATGHYQISDTSAHLDAFGRALHDAGVDCAD